MDFAGLLPDFGNVLYTVVAFVVALSIIVTVHEFGHYIVGRWSGIRAEVFSIGFGPKLFSRVDRRGTRWQVAAIPLGGYVKFLGDANAASAGADDATMSALTADERRHTMHGAPLWARAVTVVAGPVFNFILSVLIFAGIFLWVGTATDQPVIGSMVELPQGAGDLRAGDRILAVEGHDTPDYPALVAAVDTLPSAPVMHYLVEREGAALEVDGPALYPARLAGVGPGTAAMSAGLKSGDVILDIDGTPLAAFADLQAAVKAAEGRAMALTVWRPGMPVNDSFSVTLAPKSTDIPTADGGFETRWLIGATGSFSFEPLTRPTGIIEAVTRGGQEVSFIVKSSLSGLWHMVTGAISSCNLRGAIGIAETSAAAASSGAQNFIWFIAVLSTAVGFLNLFPIPVLDGGHLVFHAWEALTGKPPSDRVLNVLMAIGVALVLTLMLFGLKNDLFCP
ncbi:RIP metalloprotease RseP [Phaeovulum sp.]|uniref:RIP metalloprotease RseP n=1 Tax=Phaeovulum sp. TaxID=2934796 RepID=UPI0039E30B94